MPDRDQSSLRAALARGIAAHQAGRADEALRWYRTALDLAPDDAETLSLNGLALAHLGRPAEAEPLLRKAIRLEPAQAGFRLNLSELLERTGRLAEARQEVEEALETNPASWAAWAKLGDLHSAQNRPAEAKQAYTRAASLEPRNPDVILRLARVEASLGNLRAAVDALGAIAVIAPSYEPMFTLHCEILARRNSWPELEARASAWTRSHPASADAWRNLSHAAFELGRYRAALDAFRRVVDLSGKTAPTLTTFARIGLHAHEYETAASALVEAERLDPNHPELLATRGLLLTYQGHFREAEAYCRRCLQSDPTFAPAYTTLSRLIRGRFADRELQALEQLVKQEARPLDHRIAAAFALGHAHDAREDTPVAFAAYQYAHELCIERNRREGRRYDFASIEDRIEGLISLFPAEMEAAESRPDGDRIPIFIVGMPRSGTTLLESVLSAHSRVLAGGERPDMQQILEDFMRRARNGVAYWPEPSVTAAWRRAYFRDLPAGGATDRVTDKHPLNFHSAGLILRLFPAAVVIHIRRSPLETALSIYRNEFSKFWMFTDRLEDIAHYYGQYARLVAHWERTLMGRFFTLQYEEFAGSFETAAPALVRACGLEWEEQCRNFQSASRPISTFSAVQAREAVSVRTGAADRYRAHLGPLVDGLNAAGVDLTTGVLAGRGTLA